MPVRDALLGAAQQIAADQGFDGISLRSVAAAVGKSTTVIFQNFGGRQGLIDAALDHALESERIRHRTLLGEIGTFPEDPPATAHLVAYYIRASDRSASGRFCLEAMLRDDSLTDAAPRLQQWTHMRHAFWARVLPAADTVHARFLADYTMMEQAFCTVLSGDLPYDQLLRATALAACLRSIAPDPAADLPLLEWARGQAFPAPGDDPPGPAPMEALLSTVAARIASEGIGRVNLRRIATEAGVPPSLIIYHYGDFAAFLSAAIWRAMMHELPAYLDRARPAGVLDRADWLHGLETAMDPHTTDGAQGFYVRYARILGQVCLLARQRPELVPLVRQLRAIEGMGIHRASIDVWPPRYRFDPATASAFSIWVKSCALARFATPGDEQVADITTMLDLLTGKRRPTD